MLNVASDLLFQSIIERYRNNIILSVQNFVEKKKLYNK